MTTYIAYIPVSSFVFKHLSVPKYPIVYIYTNAHIYSSTHVHLILLRRFCKKHRQNVKMRSVCCEGKYQKVEPSFPISLKQY